MPAIQKSTLIKGKSVSFQSPLTRKEHEINRIVMLKDTFTECSVRLHYEDGDMETFEKKDQVKIIGQPWECSIVDMGMSEGVNGTVELENKDGAKNSANVILKHASIEKFIACSKRKRKKASAFKFPSSAEATKPKKQVSKVHKPKKTPSEANKRKVAMKTQDEMVSKKKTAPASDPPSPEKHVKKNKNARQAAHGVFRKSVRETDESAIYEGVKKVNLDDDEIDDWDDSPSETVRMTKISKSKNLSCKKKVGGKNLSAWVDCMQKLKGTKCVVKSKLSKDCFVVEVAHLFAEGMKKNQVKNLKVLKKQG